ncbi:MAG: tRNA(Ile)-lysidine synthase [Bacteroidota bacterium]
MCSKMSKNATILGFSGGVDSVVLALYLVEVRGIRPHLLHVNYGLRPESNEDEQWCRWFAEEHRFKLRVLRLSKEDHPKKNIQNWARKVRYQWFADVAEELGAKTLYTAHHLDDRYETFFMNALRGSGLQALPGMTNSAIERPFKNWTKSEILQWAEQREINWREDASNATLKYTRNKVRHQLLPVLDQVDHRWRGGLRKTLNNLEQDGALLRALVGEFKKKHLVFEHGEFTFAFGDWMERNYALNLLYHVVRDVDQGFSFEEVGHVLVGDSSQRTQGKQWELIKDRKHFYISPIRAIDKEVYIVNSWAELVQFPIGLEVSEHPASAVNFNEPGQWMSAAAISFPVQFRKWKPGDAFIPLGMRGMKKVADFLNDLRLPIHHKEHVVVMISGGEILWVVGHRIADKARVVESDSKAYLALLK